MNKIVIVVKGGVVCNVFAHETAHVEIIDFDSHDDDETAAENDAKYSHLESQIKTQEMKRVY
jgi:hypothetical protein